MPLRLSLIKTDSSPSDPKPRQNSPGDAGDILLDPSSSPTLIQDESTLACAPDVHADLQMIIAAWPTLSDEKRVQILRLIQEEEVRR
jgi:hypothetical protein